MTEDVLLHKMSAADRKANFAKMIAAKNGKTKGKMPKGKKSDVEQNDEDDVSENGEGAKDTDVPADETKDGKPLPPWLKGKKSKLKKKIKHSENLFDEILQHHGVMGMKWGRHKASSSSSTKAPSKRQQKKAQNAFDKARNESFRKAYQNRDKLSTRALRNKLERQRIEQQFEEVSSKPYRDAKARRLKQFKMATQIASAIPYGDFAKEAKNKKAKAILTQLDAISKAANGIATVTAGEGKKKKK